MILIERLKVEAPFKYLWLKSVRDVNLMEHCAKCLCGDYVNQVSSRTKQLENIALHERVYYLCGVSLPYVWENNFHLAFMESRGDCVECSRLGVSCIIINAKELPITAEAIDNTHPKARFKSYNTCRNWQFANWFDANLKSS